MAPSPGSVQIQAERWGAEAKRLADSGNVEGAFELYRRAAEALPGAPWLQHRTADLARKLRHDELAIHYFRRSSEAFVRAGFQRRGIAPLRLAWTLARSHLPRHFELFATIAESLTELQRGLNLLADAEVTIDQSAEALRRAGVRGDKAGRPHSLRSTTVESLRATLAPPSSQG